MSEIQRLLIEAREERNAATQRRDKEAALYAKAAIGTLQGAEFSRDDRDRERSLLCVAVLLEQARLLLWGARDVKAADVN